MESSKIGYWLQVGANLGILAGLILVGLQMSQNEKLLRVQLAYEKSNRVSQIEVAMLGENPAATWARSLSDPESLTLEDQRIMEAYIWLGLEQWRAAFNVSKTGLLGSDWKHRVVMDAEYYLNSPYGRAHWIATKDAWPSEIVEFVDEQLESGSFSAMGYHKQIMLTAKENLAKQAE